MKKSKHHLLLKRQKIAHKREAKARKKRKEFEKLKNIGYFRKRIQIRVQKKPKLSLRKKIKFWVVLILITLYQVYLKSKKIWHSLRKNQNRD